MVTDEVRTTTDMPVETPTEPESTPVETAETAAVAVATEPPAEEPVPESAPPEEPVAEEAVAEEPVAEDVPEPTPVAEEPPAEVPPPEPPNNKHWYVVKVQSGREESIREAIERKVKIENLEEYFGQIYIPIEKITEMRNGRRYTRTRKKLPGYIMAEVEFNDRILYLFRETTGVGDFVGGTNNKPPPPMSPREVAQWLKPADPEKAAADQPVAIKHDFEKGDRVRVKDGVFKDMEGDVKDILEDKNQAKVEVSIFGRPVIIDVEYWQVERV